MPVISANRILKPRKQRLCDNDICRRLMTGTQIRLYGYAELGDKPYVLYCHEECCSDSSDTARALLRSDVKRGLVPK